MNFFASDETKKITLDNGIILEVRTDISKKNFNALLSALPQDMDSEKGLSIGQAMEFSCALFQSFVVGWNLDKDATIDNYLSLKKDAADAVDEAIGNHFSSLTPSEKESRKS